VREAARKGGKSLQQWKGYLLILNRQRKAELWCHHIPPVSLSARG